MIVFSFFFFFQAEDGIRDVAVTGVQTCALPICLMLGAVGAIGLQTKAQTTGTTASSTTQQTADKPHGHAPRSEEHTSELQSRLHLVCRLLLEKKKKEPETENKMINDMHESSSVA